VREDEYSHKGVHRDTLIDKKYIESSVYRRKFDNATNNTKLGKLLYDLAKEMLYARSGTRYESMCFIDGETTEIITKFDSMGKLPELTGADHELKVEYGDSVLHKLRGHNNIVTIHNHPNSTAPSAGDFNSAFKHGYTTCFVVTHNGRVFRYSSHEEISDSIYLTYWDEFVSQGYSNIEAQIKAIQSMANVSKIKIMEVLK
jgi:hypothetical protein